MLKKYFKNLEGKKICTAMEKMRTPPSGEGKEFWPKMGFTIPCSIGLTKKLISKSP